MPETDISSAIASDLKNVMVDYSVPTEVTDGAGALVETTWQTTTWEHNLGYYQNIPELKIAIDTKATWTVGAGLESDEPTAMLLGTIKGNGKDTFISILKNMIITKTLDGDSYAEIIRDKEGNLINLKPLDPSSIKSVQNKKGIYIRYEQVSKIGGDPKIFEPEDIFHLSRNRIADEIHGTSVIRAVEWIILARNEAMSDWKRALHRNVDPLWVFKLDTDDDDKIAEFKTKQDNARGSGENMYIPMGTVEVEPKGVAPNQTLNPLAWIDRLNDYFFQAVNTPQIITGNAKEFTDASAKIVYLSYEQSVKSDQLETEEQVLAQLNLEIKLIFPASLQNELISGKEKDSDLTAAAPNDEVVEMEGKK